MKNNLICITSEVNTATPDELPYIFVTEFNDTNVISFYKQFLTLSSKKEVQVIPVIISSFGGQVHSLLAMIDIIKSSDKPVSTIALGKAMSCGALLLAHGTKGYRYAAPNADIMLHEVSSMEWGKTTDVQNGAKQTKRLNNDLFKMLSDCAGLTDKFFFIKELKNRSNIDWYLTADEYKKLGLVDFVSVPKLIKQ